MNSKTILTAAFATLSLIGAGSAFAQKLPGEVKAQIGLKTGGSPMGYIQNSNPIAILFSTREGERGEARAFSLLKGEGLDIAIQIDGGAEYLNPGRTAFKNGEYEAAAEAFSKVVAAFPTLTYIPRNFATEAAWYQIESLRRAGKYSEMKAAMESKPATTIATHLPENFQKQFTFNKIWADLGAGDLEAVKGAITPYIIGAAGNAKLLPTENFNPDLNEAETAQLAFLRAKVVEASGDKQKALHDYYRAFTLNFGSDPALSEKAMAAALAIQAEDPQIQNEKNKLARAQLQGLAYQFKNNYGADDLPAGTGAFAIRPAIEASIVAPEESEPAEESADAKADPAKADAKGKSADPKAKGNAKAKGKAKK